MKTIDKISKVKSLMRNGLALITNFTRFVSGLSNYGGVYEIPINDLRLFDFSQGKNFCEEGALCVPTMFDVLYQNRVKTLALDWLISSIDGVVKLRPTLRYSDSGECDIFKRYIREGRFRVASLHLYDLDHVVHERGPDSRQAKRKVRELDYFLESIFNEVQESYKEVDTVIFSDHGATRVVRTLDIMSRLDRDLKPHREIGDFVAFFDSTMARFWFKDSGSRDQVISALGDISDGHLLSTKEKRELGLNFGHCRYGQEIFLVNPGVLISPNFFQGDKLVRGMHGYDPACTDMDALAIFHGDRVIRDDQRGVVNAIDWLPTVLGILGLNVPTTCEGRLDLLKSLRVTE